MIIEYTFGVYEDTQKPTTITFKNGYTEVSITIEPSDYEINTIFQNLVRSVLMAAEWSKTNVDEYLKP